MERRFQRRSFAPIKPGEELDVKIEAVGAKGDGIAKVKGFVIFVPGAKEGENIKVRITKVFRKVGFAEIVGQGSAPEESEDHQEEQYEDQSEEEVVEESKEF
ncbi:TRAM domain-containing protein [Candidatus Woesearchaeota archaeon]|nr:TRAM domain-containing protein [Candidatus Woesearchaeota archaeon]